MALGWFGTPSAKNPRKGHLRKVLTCLLQIHIVVSTEKFSLLRRGKGSETIAKLKIRPAAFAGARFHLLSDVLRSRAVMWRMCADYDGSGILGSGIVIGVRRRSGPLRRRGQRRCSGLGLPTNLRCHAVTAGADSPVRPLHGPDTGITLLSTN